MSTILQAGAASVIVLATAAATVATVIVGVPDLAIPGGLWEPGQSLDGRVYRIMQTSTETGDQTNELRFADGKFQSARCISYCNFGWTPYQTWAEGETLHFSATTHCPDAPYTMVWYGSVSGDKVEVAGSWTTRRWYWTRQIAVTGAGEAVEG